MDSKRNKQTAKPRRTATDSSNRLVVLVVGLAMAVLAYQGKQVLTRIDRLEANVARILVALGIPPLTANTRISGAKNGDSPGQQEIKTPTLRGPCGFFFQNCLDFDPGTWLNDP